MPRLATARLLLIDDDRAAAETLAQRLSEASHTVDRAHSWREGLSLAVSGEHHLILLDRGLPEVGGLGLVRILRATGLATPVLLLSASDNADARREAVDAGADDHLAKPFADTELLGRVASLARPPPKRRAPTVLRTADLELDLQKRTVVRAGQPVRLRPRDFDVLAFLVRHRGRVVTHASLLRNIWDSDLTNTRLLEASVDRIRAELNREFPVELIHAVPGVGYVLLDED
jgi:two-component system OmpR family response regulator